MKKSFGFLVVLLGLLAARGASAASYVPGEALVVYKKASGSAVTAASVERGAESFRIASLAAASGARVARTYGALSEAGDGVFVLVRSDSKTTEQLVEALRNRSDVIAVSPNRIIRAFREPNDPRYQSGELWGMKAIRAPEAWDVTTGDASVYVAVADTGIAAGHEDIQANLDTVRSRNFSQVSPYIPANPLDYRDVDGHGTHVSGTIGAAGDNGLGVAGVNWRTRLIALKVLGDDGSGTAAWQVDAINYLLGLLRTDPTMKIAALNLSLGGYRPVAPSAAHTEPDWHVMKTLDTLNRTVIVVAAGNEGLEVGKPAPKDDDRDPRNPQYKRGEYCYPASFTGLNNMIVVGAAASDRAAAAFSNWSPTLVDLTAPGVDILSTVPTRPDGTIYALDSGTSMAAPHVSGAVALLASRYPTATASQIKNALLQGADSARNPVATAPTNTGGARLSRYGYLDIKKALDFLERTSADLGPAPQPNPDPSPDPQPDPDRPNVGDIVVPPAPQTWSIARGTPDAQGNIPVEISVSIVTRTPLLSVRVRGLGMIETPSSVIRALGATPSSGTVSTASLSYTVRFKGTVPKSRWDTARVEVLYYLLEGDSAEKELKLGADGNGIPLNEMTDRSPTLPDPNPNAKTRSSGSGCDAGIGGLALALGVAFLPKRRG